jgi:hypothetical protein
VEPANAKRAGAEQQQVVVKHAPEAELKVGLPAEQVEAHLENEMTAEEMQPSAALEEEAAEEIHHNWMLVAEACSWQQSLQQRISPAAAAVVAALPPSL